MATCEFPLSENQGTQDLFIPGWRTLGTHAQSSAESGEATKCTGGADDAIDIPLVRPNPPKLSLQVEALTEIESSGVFSNYGPVNSRLEAQLVALLFGGVGGCVTVANATLGLMLAIKQAVGWRPRGPYALMPSFTFAASAHAALWCGLTPLFCDIDPDTWLPDAEAEEALLKQYGDDIAIIVPNATFGNSLDLKRYKRLSLSYNVPVVIDAAASLGSLNEEGRAFGAASVFPSVYSMHATKAVGTSEAGIVYCTDLELIASLRIMGNFGFGQMRSATMPGLNAKLSEIAALQGLIKLVDVDKIADFRQGVYEQYRSLLPDFKFQRLTGLRTAHQFVPVMLPAAFAGRVDEIVAALRMNGIGSARYFVPHLAEQPYFQKTSLASELTATEAVSRRVIALPMSDFLTCADVTRVCTTLQRICLPGVVRRTSARSAIASSRSLGSLS